MSRLEAANANDVTPSGLPVTIYSDVICPWCYVGKRRFETALETPGMPRQLAISWRPFFRSTYRTRSGSALASASASRRWARAQPGWWR